MSVRTSRLLLVVAGVVAAVVLFLVLRPSDDEASSTTPAATTPAATTPAGTTTAETETETTPTAPARPTSFAVTIGGGTVAGGLQRWSVAHGERVRIVVRSDEADQIHLHGYDIEREVAPGAPAVFAFTADLPGRFELEAHHGPGQIAQLDVEP